MKYENRICCFIDVLGFSDHIKQSVSRDNEDVEDKIKSIFDFINIIEDHTKFDGIAQSREVTQFSDSVVISFLIEERDQIFYTLVNILHLTMNSISRNFLIRGGISFGKLIHNEKMVFGPALVEAYNLESKAAQYPRVILSKSILELGHKNSLYYSEHETLEEKFGVIVTRDSDDMFYIDYIAKANSELDDIEYDVPVYLEYLIKVYNLGSKIKNPSVQVKYGWLKNKINNVINVYNSNQTYIEICENRGDHELAEYYRSLKTID